MTTEPIKIPLEVAFSALILSKSASYDGVQVKTRAPAATFDGILIADCERHRTLYRSYEAVLKPGTVPGFKTASYDLYRFSVLAQSSTEMP